MVHLLARLLSVLVLARPAALRRLAHGGLRALVPASPWLGAVACKLHSGGWGGGRRRENGRNLVVKTPYLRGPNSVSSDSDPRRRQREERPRRPPPEGYAVAGPFLEESTHEAWETLVGARFSGRRPCWWPRIGVFPRHDPYSLPAGVRRWIHSSGSVRDSSVSGLPKRVSSSSSYS